MKGVGDLFFASIVFILIILAVSFFAFWPITTEAFQSTCEKDLFDKLGSLIDRTSLPASQAINDELNVGTCVEYITSSGIKMVGEDRVRTLSLHNSGQKISFSFVGFDEGTTEIHPKDEPYAIRADPSGVFTIYEGEPQ